MIDNFSTNLQKIQQSCQKILARPPFILPITKTLSPSEIKTLVGWGFSVFGENKAQILKEKAQFINNTKVQWHFIGRLQSNKIKDIVMYSELIHSVDRLEIAEEVSKKAGQLGKKQNILLQINTSGEESKSGVSSTHALQFIESVWTLPNIQVLGLMTMAPYTEDQSVLRDSFRKLRLISEEAQSKGFTSVKELSMGMSHDYPIALEEGATILRIGTALYE